MSPELLLGKGDLGWLAGGPPEGEAGGRQRRAAAKMREKYASNIWESDSEAACAQRPAKQRSHSAERCLSSLAIASGERHSLAALSVEADESRPISLSVANVVHSEKGCDSLQVKGTVKPNTQAKPIEGRQLFGCPPRPRIFLGSKEGFRSKSKKPISNGFEWISFCTRLKEAFSKNTTTTF